MADIEDGIKVQYLPEDNDDPEEGESSVLRGETDVEIHPGSPRTSRRLPIVSLMVITIILFCQLLDTSGLVSARDPEVTFNAFASPWFNGAGPLLHMLPNVILFALVTVPTELAVGSLNWGAIQ